MAMQVQLQNKIKQNLIQSSKAMTAFILAFLFSQIALAAGFEGGLNEAESNLTLLKTWGIRVAGVGAVVYLLWKGIETWRGRGDWGDFGMAVVHVALAGAAASLAAWAFGVFS